MIGIHKCPYHKSVPIINKKMVKLENKIGVGIGILLLLMIFGHAIYYEDWNRLYWSVLGALLGFFISRVMLL